MPTPKIIRMMNAKDNTVTAFWINPQTGELVGAAEPFAVDSQSLAAAGHGWPVKEHHATACGTTIAEISRELGVEVAAPNTPKSFNASKALVALGMMQALGADSPGWAGALNTPKIIRKRIHRDPDEFVSFWIDPATDTVCLSHGRNPERIVLEGRGVTADEADARYCGTTLDKIRAELEASDSSLSPESPAGDEREELLSLRELAGWLSAKGESRIDDKLEELGLLERLSCDGSCRECPHLPDPSGEETCYRPRYTEGGMVITRWRRGN